MQKTMIMLDQKKRKKINSRGTNETGIVFNSTKTNLPLFYHFIEPTIDSQALHRQIPSIFIAHYADLILNEKTQRFQERGAGASRTKSKR